MRDVKIKEVDTSTHREIYQDDEFHSSKYAIAKGPYRIMSWEGSYRERSIKAIEMASYTPRQGSSRLNRTPRSYGACGTALRQHIIDVFNLCNLHHLYLLRPKTLETSIPSTTSRQTPPTALSKMLLTNALYLYAALALLLTATSNSFPSPSPHPKSKTTVEAAQNCPPEPPYCTVLACGGNDGNFRCLATGALHGCQCCPEQDANCLDEECLGTNQGRCRSDKLNGCGCYILRGPLLVYPNPRQVPSLSREAIEKNARDIVQELLGGDLSRLPGYHGAAK